MIGFLTGGIPSHWSRYKVERGIALATWISDLKARLSQLQQIATHDPSHGRASIWLGGLFRPSGWITASRQQSAHTLGVSLEALSLRLDLDSNSTGAYTQDYPLKGLVLQGATWSSDSGLLTNDGQSTPVPNATLAWRVTDHEETDPSHFECPIYLNADRDTVLLSASLRSQESNTKLIQRGVCLLAHADR